MPGMDGIPPHTPIKPSHMSQPSMQPGLQPGGPEIWDPPEPIDRRDKSNWVKWFFNSDNPFWLMVPIILSVAALWFAYKSNIINREWADVHMRIVTQAFMGWQTPGDYFIEDDIWYFRGKMGSLENIDDQMNTVTIANNDLGLRWLAESVGWDIDNIDPETLPFLEYYIFLAFCNDGDQIAQDLYVDFDYYRVENFNELRGEEAIPEGVEPETWTYGPSVLAPGQWIIIPLGKCFIRLDPTNRAPAIKYMGDFCDPVELRYVSAVSGPHVEPLNMEEIPQTMNAFLGPSLPADDSSSTDTAEFSPAPENRTSNDNGTLRRPPK
jgi:hypothetical protein